VFVKPKCERVFNRLTQIDEDCMFFIYGNSPGSKAYYDLYGPRSY